MLPSDCKLTFALYIAIDRHVVEGASDLTAYVRDKKNIR